MKTSQRQLYADRIDRVVVHLEARVSDGEAPTVAELADTAALSPYHFHRVFRLMTGETVGGTIRRLRLARALPEIQGEVAVTRAAGASGYATSQGFARALQAQAGTTARTARSSAVLLDSLAAALRRPRDTTDSAPPMEIEVVSVNPFRLLAVRNVGDYAELNAGYHRVFEHVLAQVAPEDLLGIYGIPHDDPRFTPAAECRFDCALAVPAGARPEGELAELEVGGGTYLRLRHLGDYDRLHETVDLAYASAIAIHDREIASTPLFIHYLDDPEEVAEADLRSDIFLPLL